jgi:hypothetical protein
MIQDLITIIGHRAVLTHQVLKLCEFLRVSSIASQQREILLLFPKSSITSHLFFLSEA